MKKELIYKAPELTVLGFSINHRLMASSNANVEGYDHNDSGDMFSSDFD